jgi:hopanoid-associated phosphorylase
MGCERGVTLGVIVGFGAEAALVPKHCRVAMAGGRPERAFALASAMAAEGVSALISFGIAGGLAPDLSPGSLVVGESVVCGGRAYPCSHPIQVPARRGVVAAAEAVVTDAAAKAALFASTGALCVDLESGGVARAAEAAGLPFAVLRAVADPASRALPPAACIGLDEQGRVRLGAVLASLARSPGQLAGLVRVGLDTRAALAALAALKGVAAGLG